MKNKIKIALLSSEVSPLAKVGGLADVVGSLPKSFDTKKIDARVIIPAYEQINLKAIMAKTVLKTKVVFGVKSFNVQILVSELPNSKVPLYLISETTKLSKGPIYEQGRAGEEKQTEKFLFLCKAVLQTFEHINWIPDVIHAHDWPTAPISLLLSNLPPKSPLSKVKSLITIHNIHHQNYSSLKLLERIGVQKKNLSPQAKSKTDPKYYNLFAQSLLTADAVNTVSPTYAKEILTSEYGSRLQDILKSRSSKTMGILNGIDVNYYNPQTDQSIFFRYASGNLQEKKFNKTDLQKKLKLTIGPDKMLAGMVTRIDSQKGIELVIAAIKKLVKNNIQFVILGSGDKKISQDLTQQANKHSKSFVFLNRYDHPLARKIYAGSDIFLMPSRFEPCGLTQLIAMRYGTLPVVRSTGGLKDTVIDYQKKDGYGFVFDEFSDETLIQKILSAQKLFLLKNLWKTLQLRAMKQDFSWKKSAKEYEKLYLRILKK